MDSIAIRRARRARRKRQNIVTLFLVLAVSFVATLGIWLTNPITVAYGDEKLGHSGFMPESNDWIPDQVRNDSAEVVVAPEYNVPQEPPARPAWKSWMAYQMITDPTSKQWALQQQATTAANGIRLYDGLPMVAVGTAYASNAGEKIVITLESGLQFEAIVGDIKADIHTDPEHKYAQDGSVVEFIVDGDALDPLAKKLGDVSCLGYDGAVVKIYS